MYRLPAGTLATLVKHGEEHCPQLAYRWSLHLQYTNARYLENSPRWHGNGLSRFVGIVTVLVVMAECEEHGLRAGSPAEEDYASLARAGGRKGEIRR